MKMTSEERVQENDLLIGHLAEAQWSVAERDAKWDEIMKPQNGGEA